MHSISYLILLFRLLQVVLEEGQYRSQLPVLQAQLAAAGARGVWEERLPPELNAALQVRLRWLRRGVWPQAGCVGSAELCRLAPPFVDPYRPPPIPYHPAQLGCVAVVAPSARSRTLGAGFDLAELHMRPVAQVGWGWFGRADRRGAELCARLLHMDLQPWPAATLPSCI